VTSLKLVVWTSVIVLLLASIFLVLVYPAPSRVVLIADESLPIVDSVAGGRVVGSVSSGGRVDVVRCEDIKTDIVPRIRLADAKTEGYVTRGRYRLEKTPIWSSWSGPIAVGCL